MMRELIVKLDEQERFRLAHLSPTGGTPRPIQVKSDYRLIAGPCRQGAQAQPLAPVSKSSSLSSRSQSDPWARPFVFTVS